MIIFPIFADQDFNANSLESKGLCIKMEFASFTQNELENGISELVSNEQLKTNIQLTSHQFRDRPMSPVETAVWWTEYVLRHKDTRSLMSVTRHQSWFEKRLLDVWIVLLLAAQAILAVTVITSAKLYKAYKSASTTEAHSANSKKLE
jgi:glucuronosyltransferase